MKKDNPKLNDIFAKKDTSFCKKGAEQEVSEYPPICPYCNGVGYICRVFGETKTCLKCLRAGRLG